MRGYLNYRHMKKLQKGFTLVELLVVIAIIGILATLVLLQLGTARARARDAQRITAVNQLRTALEEYYGDNGSYPTGPLTSANIGPTSSGKYLSNLPVEPNGGVYNYVYSPVASPTKFQVWVLLEGNAVALKSDTDIDSTGYTVGQGAINTVAAGDSTCSATPANCVYDQGVQ